MKPLILGSLILLLHATTATARNRIDHYFHECEIVADRTQLIETEVVRPLPGPCQEGQPLELDPGDGTARSKSWRGSYIGRALARDRYETRYVDSCSREYRQTLSTYGPLHPIDWEYALINPKPRQGHASFEEVPMTRAEATAALAAAKRRCETGSLRSGR